MGRSIIGLLVTVALESMARTRARIVRLRADTERYNNFSRISY